MRATAVRAEPVEGRAVEALLSLAEHAQTGRPVPADVAAWFASAVARWLTEGEPLPSALGITGAPSDPSARLAYLRAVRDRHLCGAHGLVEGTTPWARSKALAAAIRRFEADAWPRLRHQDAPPPGCSELRRRLFLAFATGAPVPSSARQVHRVVTSPPLAMSQAGAETDP